RLGAALVTLGRSAEAEDAYRESIAHDEWLAERFGDRSGVYSVLVPNQEALAHLLLASNRQDEAKALLDKAKSELLAIETARPNRPGGGRRLADCFAQLAESYKALGDQGCAAELNDRADRYRRSGPNDEPAGRNRRGGGRPPGPGDDRRRPPGPHPSQ
ncbi:MAG: hypothetical protein ACLQGP_21295, partial [Isosphaeraceae bacterium]